MQSALNFQLDLKCGVTFSSRKVAWEIVKHCLLLKTVPVHRCSRSPLGGVHVCIGSTSSSWRIQCFHTVFHTEYGMKFHFSPLTLIQLAWRVSSKYG